LQQGDLALQATGVTGQRTLATDHTVAGHDDTERIAPDRRAHRARGRRLPQVARDFAVALRHTIRNRAQPLPHTLLKGRTQRYIQRQRKAGGLRSKVGRELGASRLQHGVCGIHLPLLRIGLVRLPVEPDAAQALRAGGQGHGAQRAVVGDALNMGEWSGGCHGQIIRSKPRP